MKRGFDEHQLRGVDVAFDRPDRGGRNRRRWGSLHRISCAWVRPSDVEKRRADSIGRYRCLHVTHPDLVR
jgi:hypothetical protein